MAETENFALEVIKRIHHELGAENSADKLKLVIKSLPKKLGLRRRTFMSRQMT